MIKRGGLRMGEGEKLGEELEGVGREYICAVCAG